MMTAVWLASQVGVTAAAISKYETRNVTPSHEILRKLSDVLGVPQAYFFKAPHIDDGAPFLMRSNTASTKRARDAAQVKATWIREIISFSSQYVSFPSNNLPLLVDVTDPCVLGGDDIESAANQLRRHWGLRHGPIGDLTGLMEANGVIVSRFPFGARKFDGFSKGAREAPIAASNTERCTGVRVRFDLAHELGHLVMHRQVPSELANRPEIHKLMEKQAHRFAGAFLFPAESFTSEVYTISLGGLIDLKARWRISAQAMIYRARHLGMVSEDQMHRAFKAIGIAGFRTSEPLDDTLEIEEPGILASAFDSLKGAGFSGHDVASTLGLAERDIEMLANLPAGALSSPGRDLGARASAQVIPLRRREQG